MAVTDITNVGALLESQDDIFDTLSALNTRDIETPGRLTLIPKRYLHVAPV